MKLIILLTLLTPSIVYSSLGNCGLYEARGIVRDIKSNSVLVINEKTLSETQIHFSIAEQAKILLYENKDVTAKVLLLEKFNGTVGVSDAVSEVNRRIPNPLNPEDTGLILITKKDCTKK